MKLSGSDLSEEPVQRARYTGLQVVRGLASIAVAIYHAEYVTGLHLFNGTGPWPILHVFRAGVEVFFVLSGFVIFSAHAKDLGQPDQVPRYLRKRLVRIYPIYWIAVLGLIIGQVATRSLDGSLNDAAGIVQNISLIPLGGSYTLTVSWTLGHEMLFYLVFLSVFTSRALFVGTLSIWALAIIFSAPPTGNFVAFMLSPFNLLFLMGVSAAAIFRSYGSHRFGGLIVALGMLGLLAAAIADARSLGNVRENFTLYYGLSAAALIYGLTVWEAQSSLNFGRTMPFLGDASYSIYLVHAPAMTFAALVLGKVGLLGSGPVLFVVLLLFGMVAGVVFYLVFEKPLLNYFQQDPAPKIRAKEIHG